MIGRSQYPSSRRKRGVTFVIVLAVLVALMSIVTSYTLTQRALSNETAGRNEQIRARIAAEAGMARALAELETVSTTSTTSGTSTTLSDSWATLGNNGAEEFTLGNSSFRLQIIDSASKLSLNSITEDGLYNLGLSQEQVDSLLDWRETGQTPRAQGAKDQYYNSLTEPYNARLSNFQSVDELLLVRGFNPRILYNPDALYENTTAARPTQQGETQLALADLLTTISYSPNNDPNGDARLNLNNAQTGGEQAIQQRLNVSQAVAEAIANGRQTQPNGSYTSLGQVLQLPAVGNDPNTARQILDYANVAATEQLQGKVNFNTASVQVLAAIPGIGIDLANSIISRQTSQPFTKLSDILDISTTPQFVQGVADYASVQSSAFEVRCEGRAGQTRVTLIGTVVIENSQPRIVRIAEAPFDDMASRWGWDDVSTTTSLQEPR